MKAIERIYRLCLLTVLLAVLVGCTTGQESTGGDITPEPLTDIEQETGGEGAQSIPAPPLDESAVVPLEETLAPERELPVVGWYGIVQSLPDDRRYDDSLVLLPQGSGEIGLTGVDASTEAQIGRLRESAQPAHFWGTLNCGVPDYWGCQVLVTRLRPEGTGQLFAPDPVEGWEGQVFASPGEEGQFDDYFVLAGPFLIYYGIEAANADDQAIQEQLAALRNTSRRVRIWGQVTCGVSDVNGCRIAVERLEE